MVSYHYWIDTYHYYAGSHSSYDVDINQPLLVKYKFDVYDFLKGSESAYVQIYAALNSRDFRLYCTKLVYIYVHSSCKFIDDAYLCINMYVCMLQEDPCMPWEWSP